MAEMVDANDEDQDFTEIIELNEEEVILKEKFLKLEENQANDLEFQVEDNLDEDEHFQPEDCISTQDRNIERNGNIFHCDICKKRFSSHNRVVVHMRKHSNKKVNIFFKYSL